MFLADALALIGEVRRRSGASRLEPVTLLAALAASTERIGLIATASTTYGHPFDVARRFAGLDHISGGRAGWNIVTSAGDDLARNYGFDEQAAHEDRYRGAEEFVEVVTRLWDSWDDDAVVVDKEGGVFIDDTRCIRSTTAADRLAVAGPLDVPRSPQGQPVLRAGGLVTAGSRLRRPPRRGDLHGAPDARRSARLLRRHQRAGRLSRPRSRPREGPPGLGPIVGDTQGEALAVHERLERHASMTSGLSMRCSCSASTCPAWTSTRRCRGDREHQAQGAPEPLRPLVDFVRDPGPTLRELMHARAAAAATACPRRPGPDRRHDPGVVRGGRRRRLQPHAAHAPGEPGGLRGPRRPRAAATRDLPAGLRGRTLRDHYGLERRPARSAQARLQPTYTLPYRTM